MRVIAARSCCRRIAEKLPIEMVSCLAISSPVESVWASPPDVEINKQQKNALAKLLTIKTKDIDKKIANREREFVYLKRRISPDLAAKVMSLEIPGVFLQREYKRFYPAGDVTAHLVGFTGIDDNGQEGFELAQNSVLSGKAGQSSCDSR